MFLKSAAIFRNKERSEKSNSNDQETTTKRGFFIFENVEDSTSNSFTRKEGALLDGWTSGFFLTS
ncbi:MAG: hypothetical protein Q8P67_09215, partial [archaeon]|nr:hypothetical protein [archaeon]